MKIKNLLFFTILIVGIFTACEEKEIIDENMLAPSKDIVKELPTFNLTTTSNQKVVIKVTKDAWIFENYKNKVILLNFFATWCPPCKTEIPHLNSLQKKYAKDFQVLSILVERDKPNAFIDKFIKKYNVQYPITNSPVNFDLVNAVGGVKAIPTMFLFNKDGVVEETYIGVVSEEILNSDIKKMLSY